VTLSEKGLTSNAELRPRDAYEFGGHFPIGAAKKLTEKILSRFPVILWRVLRLNAV
jgi:hypothetical protein